MRLYWRERRAGQRLILFDDEEQEIEVGAVRQTPRGFDALAKTNTYDPGRAQKGFATLDEAKEFVEWFHPWDIFGGDLDLEVETKVQPSLSGSDPTPPQPAGGSEQASTAEPPVSEVVSEVPSAEVSPADELGSEEAQSSRRGWRFWQKH